ncbi:MAG: dephospho-CoA kinase [Actinomycetota bacterium]
MLLVGLTGGIGAGKSTVARMLAERGAVVFDADHLARAAIEPGTDGYDHVIERFGSTVVGPDGSVDRDLLADLVFEDEAARRDLEAIIHPEVGRLFREFTRTYRDTDHIVVYDVPLLVETGMQEVFDLVVVVEAPEEVRVARLLADRRMSEGEARARISAQATDEQRASVADVVVRNAGNVSDFERQVEEVWQELRSRVRIIEAP